MNSKLKIGGCVVLYNPDVNVLDNISTYIDIVEELIVVDNSSRKAIFLECLKEMPKVKYVFMNGNKGIASALDKGIRILRDDGFDVVLTMDQDSKFPYEEGGNILAIVNENFENYGILGLNFNAFVDNKTNKVIDVKTLITSGNFVKLSDYLDVNGFNTELFIDYVDFDFNNRLLVSGKKIGLIQDYSLIHKIGNPIEINLFGKTFYAMNHSPIRYYYRYRNSLYLYFRDKKFYRKLFLKEIFVNIPKMLLYEPNKLEKLKMIIRGVRDGINGRLGSYSK